jgi:hypothetical protein
MAPAAWAALAHAAPRAASAILAACLLTAAAGVYLLVAWSIEPGFFDGFAPPSPVPYRWVSPPPDLAAANRPPVAVHETVTVQPGVQTLGVGTSDRQAQLLFQPGTFAGSAPVQVDVQPVTQFPRLAGTDASTNVYLIRASAPLTMPATVRLLFSERSHGGSLYRADYPDGPWQAIGSTDPRGLPYYQGQTTALPAYFAGGAATAAGTRPRGSQPTLQIVLIAGVVLVLLGAVPLLLVRRRQASGARPPP